MLQSEQPVMDKKWTAEDMPDQSDKVFVVTGANSGLGLEASLQLTKKNATVIMACRNMEKAEQAAEEIKEEVPEAKLDPIELDLASFESIETFADKFTKKYDRLDGLLNNAGIMQPPRKETEEGFELQFGVNHLGHFYLTGLLFDTLASTPDSRIVNQSSFAHKTGGMNFEDINFDQSYSRTASYSQSKMANLLFTYELHRKLQQTDIDTKSVAVHPGYTATNLQHNGPTVGGKSIWSRIYSLTNKIFAQDVSMGTLPLLYAATMPDVESGDFFGPGGFMGMRGYTRRVKSNKASYNEEDAQRLWTISKDLADFTYPIPSEQQVTS